MSTTEASMTQAERTALSDRRMLDAAIQLIVERGPEKTTLKALGDVSGYSRGLVTYRFGSKAGLFKAVIKQVSERFAAKVDRAVGDRQGIDAILVTAETYYRFVLSSPKDIRAMQILFHLAAEPHSPLAGIVGEVQKKQQGQLAEWIETGQSSGNINRALCPKTFAAQFAAYTLGMTFFWMLDRRSVDWATAHETYKETIQKQLAA